MGLILDVFDVVGVVVKPSRDGEGLDLLDNAAARSG